GSHLRRPRPPPPPPSPPLTGPAPYVRPAADRLQPPTPPRRCPYALTSPLITARSGQTALTVDSCAPPGVGGFFWSLQRFLVRRFVVAKMGRPALPREVRVAFWDGVRSGLGVEEAAAAAGASRNAAWRWMRAAGGVKGNGERAGSGRFLQAWEREEISIGLAQRLSCRQIAARLAPGRSASTVSREVRRNSVRGTYRAHLAGREARERARRPKPAKLAVDGE